MRIALATYGGLPSLNDDDRLLIGAFAKRGAEALPAVWDTPWDPRRFDAVILRSCWDYCGRREAFVAWARSVEDAGVPLLNPSSVVEWNSHKGYLRELEASGTRVVPTVWFEQGGRVGDVFEKTRAAGWSRIVVKPSVSSNADDTHLWEPEKLLTEGRILADLVERGPVLVQPFLTQIQSLGEWSLIFFGGRYSHAVRKLPASGDYRVQFTRGGTHFREDPPADLLADAARAAMRAPRHLYVRVDLIPDERGGGLLGELEMVEPYLHFQDDSGAADRFCDAALRLLDNGMPIANGRVA